MRENLHRVRDMAKVMAVAAILVALSVSGVGANYGGNGSFKCPKAFFTFGDSLSDTGNAQATFPTASRLYPPYGISYTFHDKPGFNRYSDGRLIVDFVGQANVIPPPQRPFLDRIFRVTRDVVALSCQLLMNCVSALNGIS